MAKQIKVKSKEMIEEASDIVRNAETDEAAIAFLKDTLEDDYPDLDLGRMNLHEAINTLDDGTPKKSKQMKIIEDLNKSLGDFIDRKEKSLQDARKKSKFKTKTKSKRKQKNKKR